MAYSDCSTFALSGTQCSREKYFCEFYSDVVQTFYHKEIECDEVQNLLRRTNELSVTSKKIVQDENFRCAYLCQLGVHDTCVVIKHFYDFIKKYPILIDKLRKKEKIYIVCLGSAVVLEAVGICTVIDEALKQFGFLDNGTTEIYILVIHKDEAWKSISEYVIRDFKQTLKRVQLHFRFHTEHHSSRFSEKATYWLEKADIVTMVKFLSLYASAEKVKTVIQILQDAMKKKAVLFYIANDDKHYKILSKKWEYFSNVYSPDPMQYTLKQESIKFQADLYSNVHLKFSKYEFFPVISSVWIKEKAIKTAKTTRKAAVTDEKIVKLGHNSSNKIRNTDKKMRLVGRFASMDMEKKFKDNSHRLKAKEVSTSRFANFDDDY